MTRGHRGSVEIEVRRAHHAGPAAVPSLSLRALPQAPNWPRFSKPPYDPGRSDFPSPVLASAPTVFVRTSLPPRRETAVLAHPSPRHRGVCITPSPRRKPRRPQLRVWLRAHRHDRRVPRAPLPSTGVTRAGAASRAAWRGVTPSSSLIRAHAPDHPPPNASGRPWPLGLRRLSPVPAAKWPFPTLSLRSFPRCSDPYPSALPGCTYPLLHRGHRSHPRIDGFDARISPHMAASMGTSISRLQSFDHLRAPALARPPGCSHRSGITSRQAAGPFTPRIAQPVTRTGMWRRYMLDTDD